MILEGLVTTITANNDPHLAPMGPIVNAELTQLLLRPFRTSNTYQNLHRHQEGIFHLTDDARLIAYAAMNALQQMPRIRPAAVVAGVVLVDACEAFEFRVRSIDASQERVQIVAEIVHRNKLRDFLGFNRAKHAVIEAAILATRFHLLPVNEIALEFKKLRIIVDKTGGDAEFEAMTFLESEWAKFQEGGRR
jgi:uncharacterized protein